MEKRKSKWKGVYTALVTPFLPSGEIDWPSYKKLLQTQCTAKVAGVVPNGTTGESPTLTLDEKKKLISVTLEELSGSGLKIIPGTGSNNTVETVALSRWASEQGADGILVVTPYYNKPSQAGLVRHYTETADSVKCDVILYNVPGRTSVGLTAETIAQLAKHPKIAAIKEATGNLAFASEVVDALRTAKTEMALLSGDDLTFLPFLSLGGDGVISVATNIIPSEFVDLQSKFEKRNITDAREIHERYFGVFKDLFIEANPVPVKHAMSLLGLCGKTVRPPLADLTPESASKLTVALKKSGLLEKK